MDDPGTGLEHFVDCGAQPGEVRRQKGGSNPESTEGFRYFGRPGHTGLSIEPVQV
jgi:hypothetical protein